MVETDDGLPMFIAGRDDIDNFRTSGKMNERVEIYWKYTPVHNGMPSDKEGELMEQVLLLLRKTMEKDKLAILTAIYTGAGERTMVFYTRTSRIFGERLNTALADFDLLPISIYVENDAEWNEYAEMCEVKPYAD